MSDFFTVEEREFIKKEFSECPHKDAASDITHKAMSDGIVDIRHLYLIGAYLEMKLGEYMSVNPQPLSSDKEWLLELLNIIDKVNAKTSNEQS